MKARSKSAYFCSKHLIFWLHKRVHTEKYVKTECTVPTLKAVQGNGMSVLASAPNRRTQVFRLCSVFGTRLINCYLAKKVVDEEGVLKKRCKTAVQDNITHVEMSAAHNKCAASKCMNGSLPFGTCKTLSNIISKPHRLRSSGESTVLFLPSFFFFFTVAILTRSSGDTGAIN